MSNLTMLRKQHTEVLEIMSNIDTLIKKGNFDIIAKDIAYNINALAGKLKMHLMSEDKFLYPNLVNSNSNDIKHTAQTFYNEMGDVAEIFTSFVQKYNVPSKILQNREAFHMESKEVFNLVISRINKEDIKLYPLLEK